VARRSELAIDARRGELRKQVLVEGALGIAIDDRQRIDHVHRRDQQVRLLDHQLRVLHVLAERRTAIEFAEVREDLIANHAQHLGRVLLLEVPPAPRIVLAGKTALERLLRALRFALAGGFHQVE
jgi:hypothetical protein